MVGEYFSPIHVQLKTFYWRPKEIIRLDRLYHNHVTVNSVVIPKAYNELKYISHINI